MNLAKRIELLVSLGKYIISEDPAWQEVKEKAAIQNKWFIPGFIQIALNNIARSFLSEKNLKEWAKTSGLPTENRDPKSVGIVMAGNIPLVGFHDLLCVFISGHIAVIKPSSQDDQLIKHLVAKLTEWEHSVADRIRFSERLNNCYSYIATGSNNTSRYFEYYFGKYPHIIRRNRTSVAVLTGNETQEELTKLSDDINIFFGRGCRNVTKLYVPPGYDFVPLLEALSSYSFLIDHNKYKNNFDYNLAIHVLNKRYYMTNGFIILVEDPSFFSRISQLNFEYYSDREKLLAELEGSDQLQCIVGDKMAFGQAQFPSLTDYADGVDTMKFLANL